MPVGQRAPTLNMSKLLRQIGYRTGQSRKITYYRESYIANLQFDVLLLALLHQSMLRLIAGIADIHNYAI